MIDRMLHEEIGDVASKLHTGRSRNDQVATATRLWTMDACSELDAAVRALQQVMIDQAPTLENDLMPSYTHHAARSARFGRALDAVALLAARARSRAHRCRRHALRPCCRLAPARLPARAYPISRVLLQGSLGFASLSQNSIDAVGDRDFVAELLFVVAMIGDSSLAPRRRSDLYGSSEFGFVKFGDAFTTGSSMMPQKRNPDALELARGSGARAIGDLATLLATLKGLPSGYNKDLQDDKRALFDAVDTDASRSTRRGGHAPRDSLRREAHARGALEQR